MALSSETFFNSPLTWLPALAPLAVVDVFLIKRGFPALSDWAGDHFVITSGAMALLYFHFFAWRWKPASRIAVWVDPLKWMGFTLRINLKTASS